MSSIFVVNADGDVCRGKTIYLFAEYFSETFIPSHGALVDFSPDDYRNILCALFDHYDKHYGY